MQNQNGNMPRSLSGLDGIVGKLKNKVTGLVDKAADAKANREEKRYQMPEGRQKMVIPSYLKPFILFFRGLSILLISAAIVSCTIYYGVKMLYNKYVAPVDKKDDSVVVFIVESGESLSEISSNLYDQNLVRHKGVFKYYVDFTDRTKNLKAGVYHLTRAMTMDEIIAIISKGSSLENTMTITVREGLTIEKMAEELAEQREAEKVDFDKDTFLSLCNDLEAYSADYYFLGTLLEDDTVSSRKYALEGYLFPDTYEIYLSASEDDIIRRMLDRTEEILASPEISAGLENCGMTVDEVLTLASIVEKEGTTDTFDKVSAVFHNRLSSGMCLQSDVTVQYFLGTSKLALDNGEIYKDSPYNTYMYPGLPIGPIANPGLNAIKAAITPNAEYVSGGYLFFTLTDPNSTELVFSRSASEHEAVVSQYADMWREYDAQNGNR